MNKQNKILNTKPIIIAGPCAAESEAQIAIAIREAKKRNIDFLRINLWKPRTKPGFEGLGEKGISLLIKAIKEGVNPGLEVITPIQAQMVMDTVLPHVKKNGKILMWIGSRNQNHFVQKEIARIASKDKRVYLMIKNQPWTNEEHWEGIIGHVLSGGIKKENLLNCHRGFAPNGQNLLGLRNIPDFEMSMKIRQKSNIPMLFDPSHTGGTVDNVLTLSQTAAQYEFDGIIAEVHHDPKNALTDAKQQLTWEQFDTLLRNINLIKKTNIIKKISINLSINKSKEYSIFIGSDLLNRITSFFNLNNYSKIFIITDKNIKPLFLKKVEALQENITSIVLPSGEKEKHIESIQKIWKSIHNSQCDRKSLVINLGGGVIGDMGGFAASTYMRGIDFLNIPTTLLAQVDASIGGKTAIDFFGIKNLIGTFNQPVAVIIDTQTLTTLPKREFISGFAEIIKHGLIKDKAYFEQVTAKHPLKFTDEEMINIITRSIEIKTDIVQSDETENNSRKLLNYGHTIGHAIEAVSLETPNPLYHGEAIGIGMLAEAKISHYLNLISASDLKKIKQALLAAELPLSANLKLDKVLQKIKSDKKNERGKINFTLLKGIGNALYNQNASDNLIIKSLENILDS